MPEYIERCKKCSHFQVCANVMKSQLFIREKMILEENPECEHFISDADVVENVHSKWIERNNERRCPICHYFYMTSGTTIYNFCPMCGAKMDGKRKDCDWE